jgi:tetratricopeptide (TPR) repeat protein
MARRKTTLILILTGLCLVVMAAVLNVARSANWGVRASAAGGAIALFGAAIVQPLINTALDRRRQIKAELDHGILMPAGKPPLVRSIVNPISMGVHAAPRSGRADDEGGQLPPYVPRDIDPQLRQALTSSRFILLVGPAAAGKTRTGYEAAKAVLPSHTLIAPDSAKDIPAAITAARGTGDCVLWLDSVQRYLGISALTSKSIYGLLTEEGHHVVLATLRATEESRLIRISESPSGDQLIRDGRALLDLVDKRIVVSREFSDAERSRAVALAAQDSRLADALRHADRYGVAEYLSSGPQLRTEWDDAWERGAHPRGAAFVAAAVDCRRAGFAAPLPPALLSELSEEYLGRRGGSMLRPEPVEDALAWATALRDSASSLLWPTGDDRYDVFDYLVDVRTREQAQPVPEPTVRAALRFAEPGDAVIVAATAWYQGRPELAELGFRSAYAKLREIEGLDAAATLSCRSDLAVVLHAIGKLPDAEAEYRAILDLRTATVGADHPETLTSRSNLAAVLHEQGRLTEAEEQYRVVLNLRSSTLGAEHPSVLTTRNNLGVLLTQRGRISEAEAELDQVVRLRTKVLGADHPHTAISRRNLGAARRKRSGG